jgi:spore coat protein CotF
MQAKEMVNDILAGTNCSLGNYAKIIAETDNEQLRDVLIQIRNADEKFQYQLYLLAKDKGFYKPADAATQTEIDNLKNNL